MVKYKTKGLFDDDMYKLMYKCCTLYQSKLRIKCLQLSTIHINVIVISLLARKLKMLANKVQGL